MVKLREKLSAREDELVSVRSQVESLKKEVCSLEAKRLKEQLEASGAERDFSKQLATLKEDTVRQRCEERAKFDAEQQRLREEKDILQVRHRVGLNFVNKFVWNQASANHLLMQFR